MCKAYQIKLIRGAEISTSFEHKEFHVLAYDFDFENKEMIDICKQSERVYADIDLELIKKMRECFIIIYLYSLNIII